ncbi:MAG: FliM/FliN family flagellar motor switch protein [Pirellula sp.]
MQPMHEVDRDGGAERDACAPPHAGPSWEVSAHERVMQAESALHAMEQSLAAPQFSRFAWSELTDPTQPSSNDGAKHDVAAPSPEVNLHMIVGRTRLSRQELESLGPGAVVSLEQSIEEPIEIQVDGRVVARGEILLHQDRYCIRVTEVHPGG